MRGLFVYENARDFAMNGAGVFFMPVFQTLRCAVQDLILCHDRHIRRRIWVSYEPT